MKIKGMLRPTRSYLVCSIFVCLCVILEPSFAEQSSSTSDSLINTEESHQNFIHDQSEHSLVKPQFSGKEISFPIAPIQAGKFHTDLMVHQRPSKETVVVNGTHSTQQMQDMNALNAKMQRDIVFDDAQSGDPMKNGLRNAMDISINGDVREQSKENNWLNSGTDDSGIENTVDNAMVSKQHGVPVDYKSQTGSPEKQRLGNYMNIDVSGIEVRAINTVEGGSAVATSNIIIKPVQIINCPPEVEEKLK